MLLTVPVVFRFCYICKKTLVQWPTWISVGLGDERREQGPEEGDERPIDWCALPGRRGCEKPPFHGATQVFYLFLLTFYLRNISMKLFSPYILTGPSPSHMQYGYISTKIYSHINFDEFIIFSLSLFTWHFFCLEWYRFSKLKLLPLFSTYFFSFRFIVRCANLFVKVMNKPSRSDLVRIKIKSVFKLEVRQSRVILLWVCR